MTIRFVLVRHAACASTDSVLLGRTMDAPLDARGRAQARELAAQLAGEHPVIVVTSPRLRARQTAVAIAGHSGCTMRILDTLDEVDFGEWSGQSFAALARDPQWQYWNTHRGIAATPAGDTLARVRDRASAGLRALADECDGHTVIVVSHAEIIRALLLRARRMPVNGYWRLQVPPASVNVLLLHDSEFRPVDEGSLAA